MSKARHAMAVAPPSERHDRTIVSAVAGIVENGEAVSQLASTVTNTNAVALRVGFSLSVTV